jgi:hypothetical protein
MTLDGENTLGLNDIPATCHITLVSKPHPDKQSRQ